MKKRRAYSYTRFSTGKQDVGRSKARQDVTDLLAQRFITQHNLQVVETMTDAGISSFRGANTKTTAALGKFIELVKAGTIPKGSVLIVENLDRFSRSPITQCTTKFLELINAGIAIGVASLNVVLDEQYINNNPGAMAIVHNEFVRARAESERKSVFTKDSIRAKVERAKAGELVYFGGFAPSWLTGVKEGKWQFNTERVLIVKRIFSMYLAGESCNSIARIFNQEGIPCLQSAGGDLWWQSSVRVLLSNPNVTGHCSVNGFTKDDYYPVIISPAIFQKVQTRLAMNAKTRGGSRDNTPNLFRSLIFCAECGSGVDVEANYSNPNRPYFYAVCRNGALGYNCKNNKRVTMPLMELAIFSHFPRLEAQPAPYHPQIESINNEIAKADMAISRFTDLLADPALSDLTQLKAKLKEAMATKEAAAQRLADEKAKVSKVTEAPKTIGTLWSMLEGKEETKQQDKAQMEKWANSVTTYLKDKDNRKKVRNLMPDIFEKITLAFTVKDAKQITVAHCTIVNGTTYKVKLVKQGRNYTIET